MIKGVSKYGPRNLASATGLSDSAYPVLYCDSDLVAVDMNEAASRLNDDKFRGADMKSYISAEDAGNIAALLYSYKFAPAEEELSICVKIIHTRDFSWALVVPRDFFGVMFAEFRLFKSRRQMLSSYDTHELIFPVKPRVPTYVFKEDRSGSEELGAELGEVFAYNMLSNIYSLAMREPTFEIFDVAATVRRIASEASRAFRFNRAKWNVSLKGATPFVFPIIDRRNFINLIALAVTVFSDISADRKADITVIAGENEARIEFSTKVSKSDVVFAGDFVLPLIGKEFPGLGCRASIIMFICNLYGIGCFAKMTDDKRLLLTFVLSKDGYVENYTVKHRHVFDMKGMREAIALIKMSEGYDF